ncbi:sodium-independent sulfate anion transporter, partial [Nephila pilipes]
MKGCNTIQGLWWSLATARNALLVILCSGFASACLAFEKNFFSLTQHVDAGMPPFQIPQFSFQNLDPVTNSTTYKSCADVFK